MDSGWRLDGSKRFVLDGHAADAMLIAALAEGEAALFLAKAESPGLARDARTLVDGRRVASLTLDGVAIDAGTRLEGGAATIDDAVDIGRAVISAALCGVAEEAFARTVRYLKERRQFDRRIGSFQALQHRAARMRVDIENAWSATLKALHGLFLKRARVDSMLFGDAAFHADRVATMLGY
jgi:acyl-CoA dehydrogenase